MDQMTVKRVAGIAHIDLTDEELKSFEDELGDIFNLLKILDDAPKCDSLCFDPVGVYDVLREDVPVLYGGADGILDDMNTYNGLVRGPKIV